MPSFHQLDQEYYLSLIILWKIYQDLDIYMQIESYLNETEDTNMLEYHEYIKCYYLHNNNLSHLNDNNSFY